MQCSYFSVISGFPHKKVHPFRNFLAVLPSSHPIQKKKYWIHASNFICGVRAGLGLCELENAPEMQKYPETFVYDCSLSTDAPFPPKKKNRGESLFLLGEGYLCTGYVFTHTQNSPVEPNTLYRGALTNW